MNFTIALKCHRKQQICINKSQQLNDQCNLIMNGHPDVKKLVLSVFGLGHSQGASKLHCSNWKIIGLTPDGSTRISFF